MLDITHQQEGYFHYFQKSYSTCKDVYRSVELYLKIDRLVQICVFKIHNRRCDNQLCFIRRNYIVDQFAVVRIQQQATFVSISHGLIFLDFKFILTVNELTNYNAKHFFDNPQLTKIILFKYLNSSHLRSTPHTFHNIHIFYVFDNSFCLICI